MGHCYVEESSSKLRLIIPSLSLAPGKKGGRYHWGGHIWGGGALFPNFAVSFSFTSINIVVTSVLEYLPPVT